MLGQIKEFDRVRIVSTGQVGTLVDLVFVDGEDRCIVEIDGIEKAESSFDYLVDCHLCDLEKI